MRRTTFQDHTRFDTRDMTCSVEPTARCIIPSKQQKRLISQLGNFQHRLACQTMFRRDDRQHMTRPKEPPAEVLVTGCHKRQMNIATFQAFRDTGTAVLNEVDVHRGMSASITRQEIRKHVFNILRTAADAQCSGLTALESARALDKGFGFLQYPPAAPQQVLAIRGELDPST